MDSLKCNSVIVSRTCTIRPSDTDDGISSVKDMFDIGVGAALNNDTIHAYVGPPCINGRL